MESVSDKRLDEYKRNIRSCKMSNLKFKLRFMKSKGLNCENSIEYKFIEDEIVRRERQIKRIVGDK